MGNIIGRMGASGGIVGRMAGQPSKILEQKINELDDRVDTIITTPAEGVSAQEIIDARGGEATLGENITEIKSRVLKNTRITEEKQMYTNLSVHKKPKPMLTIIDDDTRNELYSVIYPILQDLNVPITSAVITGRIGQTGVGTITFEQYKEMLASGLVEFISHTVSHENLTTMPITQAEQELKQSREWLIENGGNPDYFVPPFGATNDEVKSIIRKYYKASYVTFSSGYITYPPVNSYGMRRSDFDTSVVSLSAQKLRLDEALASNGWIIINTHSQYPSFSGADFRELLNYAKTIGLEIVTLGEGMKHFGNLLDIDSFIGSPDYSVIDAFGNPHGKLNNPYFLIDATNVLSTNAPTDFKQGMSVCVFSGSLGTTYGWGGGGILHNFRVSTAYAYQMFFALNSKDVKVRYWNGATWSEWLLLNTLSIAKSLNMGIITANSMKSIAIASSAFKVGQEIIASPSFVLPAGIMFNCYITSAGNAVLRLFNITGADIDLTQQNWNIQIIRS